MWFGGFTKTWMQADRNKIRACSLELADRNCQSSMYPVPGHQPTHATIANSLALLMIMQEHDCNETTPQNIMLTT